MLPAGLAPLPLLGASRGGEVGAGGPLPLYGRRWLPAGLAPLPLLGTSRGGEVGAGGPLPLRVGMGGELPLLNTITKTR